MDRADKTRRSDNSEPSSRGIRQPGMQRTLMFWFGMTSLFSCVAVGLLTYFLRAEGIRESQASALELLRDSTVGMVDLWFAEGAADIRGWAHLPALVTAADRYHQGQPLDLSNVEGLFSALAERQGTNSIELIDHRGGRVIVSSQGTERGVSVPDAVRRSVLERRALVTMDVVMCVVHDSPEVLFINPVMNPDDGAIIALLVVHEDPSALYEILVNAGGLGETGETLLVSSSHVVQSPLLNRDHAIGRVAISTEPVRRGAAGETGRVIIEDYRLELVMAAYGHIAGPGWGLVVKRDMDEIDAPVRAMGREVALATIAVLIGVLLIAFFMARRFSLPAAAISESACHIADGAVDVRAPVEGVVEFQTIAQSFNRMVDVLAAKSALQEQLVELYSATSTVARAEELFEAALPLLMTLTDSQAGSAYVATKDADRFELVTTRGVPTERLVEAISLSPPDSLMAEAAQSRRPIATTAVSPSDDLLLPTPAGEAHARSLLCIPLVWANRSIGVIGLASLQELGAQSIEAAELIKNGLGQTLAAALARGETEQATEALVAGNMELRSVNTELERQRTELQEQATELKSQRAQVEEANRLKSEFVSNMSHELRTPLNNILALSQLMLSRPSKQSSSVDQEHLEVIERNGRQLLNLINDILDVSRIESGRMDVFVTSFSAVEPARGALESTKLLAKNKGIVLRCDEAKSLPTIRSDEDRLRQILVNLIGNAVKFTEAGEVRLEVESTTDGVVYRIIDEGIGLSPEQQEHIFDAFRQADGSTTRLFGGTGLGLTISRTFAHLLGGEITVESVLGEGSIFTLTLPLEAPSSGKSQTTLVDLVEGRPAASSHRAPRRGEARTIMVVEDNEVAAEQIRTVLEEAGFRVMLCAGGAEALERSAEEAPDAVVLDLMMPEIDGFEVLEGIRARRETREVPVLVLTAKEVTAEERARLRANNLQQLIRKGSLDRDELRAKVESMFDDGSSSPTTPAKPRRTVPPSGATELLVVEDNPDNLHTIKAILDTGNFRYRVAHDGVEALESARQSTPSVILMDVNLPRMSGDEAARRIKAIGGLEGVPIVAMTARAMAEERKAALESGFDDILIKPLEPTSVIARVNYWLASARGEGGVD